jgi:hypothetical protein
VLLVGVTPFLSFDRIDGRLFLMNVDCLGTAQGNKRAMVRLTELKQQGAQRNNKKVARPTRQQAKDECIIV